MTAWWGRVGPVKRVVLAIGAAALVINLGLVALDALLGSEPTGSPSSSVSTREDGVAAWRDLLVVTGTDVDDVRVPLEEAALDPTRTLVVVDPPEDPSLETLVAVAAFVEAGGRLVAVGPGATPYAAAGLGLDPGWGGGGSTTPEVVGSSSVSGGAEALSGEGRGRYLTSDPLTPLLTGGGATIGVEAGPVVAIADVSLVWNRHLGEADNAAFALAVVGDRPVTFAEAEHGLGQAKGWGALPASWRLAAGGAVIAAALAMWSAGQRLGPAERVERTLPPPRRAYVDAVADALSRTGAAARPIPDAKPGPPADRVPSPSGGRRDP